MSFISKLVETAKSFDRKLWPNHRITLSHVLVSRLKTINLRIADVGSADGPEERWLVLRGLAKFITFEPNPRPNLADEENTVNFPIGLWSSKQKKALYVTAHPDSSSLCKINYTLFQDYLIQHGSQVVSQVEIELDTLDSCLANKDGLKPHFLKIDVEGGDLEVMIGGEETLKSTVLGLRTEATLLPLWEGAPQLWDVTKHLQNKGFTLFALGKVHWVRNNSTFGYTSQPQLVWGDAIYFVTKLEFLRRLQQVSATDRENMLIHFVTILLAHGCHDYAMEITESTLHAQLVSETIVTECNWSIKHSVDKSALVLLWLAVGSLFALAVFLIFSLLTPTRQHAKFYLKQRIGRFSFSLLRWAGKAGRPYGAAIEDQYD